MAPFTPVYSDEQREAVEHWLLDRGATVPRVVQMADAGELLHQNGKRLARFKLNAHTARDMKRRAAARRAGKVTADLAKMPPRDALEALRRRLVNASDTLLSDWEKQAKRDPKSADPERLRQIARAAREIAALPGPGEGRTPKPGAKVNGERQSGETQGGIGAAILAEHHRTLAQPAPGHPTTPVQTDNGRTQTMGATHHAAPAAQRAEDAGAGSRASSLAVG